MSIATRLLRWGAAVAVGACLLAACEEDTDKGDGKLSYLRADFAMIHTAEKGRADRFVDDEGRAFSLRPHGVCEWATTADSIYRALVYYKAKPSDDGAVEPLSVVQVMLLRAMKAASLKTVQQDPVAMESAWVSENRRFLNLGLSLKTGVAEGVDAKQTLGMVCDTVMQHESSRTYHLRLYHAQNGVPEYYSTRVYASVPFDTLLPGDTIVVRVATYEGEKVRQFAF